MPHVVFEHAHRTVFGMLAQRAYRADQVATGALAIACNDQGRHVELACPLDGTTGRCRSPAAPARQHRPPAATWAAPTRCSSDRNPTFVCQGLNRCPGPAICAAPAPVPTLRLSLQAALQLPSVPACFPREVVNLDGCCHRLGFVRFAHGDLDSFAVRDPARSSRSIRSFTAESGECRADLAPVVRAVVNTWVNVGVNGTVRPTPWVLV